jgi:hypothetical protein
MQMIPTTVPPLGNGATSPLEDLAQKAQKNHDGFILEWANGEEKHRV